MKAIVQYKYGSPDDVLELQEIDQPVFKDDEVLVRVHAAGLHIGDCFGVRGAPFAMRLSTGLLKPKHGPGYDMAGQVEAVSDNVTQFQPGDEVFGASTGTCAEYARAGANTLALKPANLTFEEAAAIPTSALARSSRCGEGTVRGEGSDQWCVRRRGIVRRADCQIVRSGSDRSVQHEECGNGPLDRRSEVDPKIRTGG